MRTLLILTALTLIISCKQDKKSGEIEDTPMQTEVKSEDLAVRGEKLMATYCYQCHDPKMSIDNNLAPPMIAVKNYYIMEETTKEAFTADLLAWMSGPKAENTKMPDAIGKYGLMSHQVYPDSVIIGIAEYLYDNEVEQPEWYQNHHEEMHGSDEQ
ncbi:MAG: hypothetical protein OEQ81_06770 [Flavobacteriaceae bacterium]|nr:hypothetical protein [Flavobacteriaceae bacterium]